MINTAVFGGAFNPVHIEHINVAMAAVKELGLDHIILVPTYHPPHKSESDVSFTDRAEMLNIAFKDFPCEVIISDIEALNDGKSYAAETLPALKSIYGDFYYIIGGDSLLNFDKWFKPRFIAENFRIAVFNRDGFPPINEKITRFNREWGAKFIEMQYHGKMYDSHILRYKLNLQMYDGGLTKEVFDYIISHNLYSNFTEYFQKLPKYLSEKRFIHSKNTAYAAACLNNNCKLGLDENDVMLAGLLHDLGKKYDNNVTDISHFDIPNDCIGTPVQHQFISAEIAKNDFNVTDASILDAIRYHTTGRANMTVFEKLIYCADMVSAEREYPGVDKLRRVLYDDFENGFVACLENVYKYLKSNNQNIYPLTTEAINDIRR